MVLIYQGVRDGRISLDRWVESSRRPRPKIFGLYPRKGAIAPGSDADIVVYDPNGAHTLSAATHHMDVDYSVYEGVRGRRARHDGALARAGGGARTASSSGRPAPASSLPAGSTGW